MNIPCIGGNMERHDLYSRTQPWICFKDHGGIGTINPRYREYLTWLANREVWELKITAWKQKSDQQASTPDAVTDRIVPIFHRRPARDI